MKYTVKLNQKVYEVEIERMTTQPSSQMSAAGTQAAASTQVLAAQSPAASARPAASAYAAASAPAYAASAGAPDGTGGAETQVECPMPGKVLSISASVGQRVSAGDNLVVIEAMKMENEIVAPRDGTVKQILISQGTTVDTGDVLAVLI